MPSFAKLMPEEKTSDINCGWGQTARMTYNPRQITYTEDEAKRQAGIAEAEPESDEVKLQLAEEICRVVKEWDMTGPIPFEGYVVPNYPVGSVIPDGDPVPFEPRVLSFIPQPLLAGIVLGITIDAQPDPKGMQKESQKRGGTRTSGKQNGVTDTLSPSLSTSVSS